MRSAPILLLTLLAGCAAVKGAEKPITLRLTVPPPVAASGPRMPVSLVVGPVSAHGVAGALRYTYVDANAPAELRQAATLFWEEPPTRVLERALVAGLRRRFASVAGSNVAVAADRRVVTELDRFEEVAAGGPARALVAFDVTVTGKPLDTGRYCASHPIAGATPSARAEAFDAAIGAAVDAFVADAAAGALTRRDC